jgi:DNA-binding Lrp family transcriptional regulator
MPSRRGVLGMRAIFVMVKCEMGQAYTVAQEAADTIEELSEMHSTSGQYDLLAKFYLDNDADIGRFVTERVQTLPGVKDTYTLIAFNAFTGNG